jgi:hypothetical protein
LRRHHHDFPLVHEPIFAAYFETTLEGERRRGHLWEQTRGTAIAALERVYALRIRSNGTPSFRLKPEVGNALLPVASRSST